MSSPALRADRLSATLRQLRKKAGLSGTETARRAESLTQTTISRFETGKRVPTEDAVRVLCRIYGASAGTRRELIAIADDLRKGTTASRTVLQRGSPSMQARIGRIEDGSARIRNFNPTLVPGLLQTHDYMRSLLSGRYSGRDLDAMVASRLARQQVLDTDRDLHLVLTEGALRWQIGSPQIMIGQTEHLADLITELPHVRLGIVPWTQPTNRPIIHGFQIFDERAVTLTTETSFALITDARDIADFVARFEIYAGFAVYGDEGRAVFQRVADEYRAMGS